MIETERLLLRPPIEADYEAFCAMWDEPEVVRFVGGKPSTHEQTWGRLLRSVGMWAIKGYGPLAVIDRRDGRLLGETGHHDFRRSLGETFDPFPEAGWVFVSRVHGKGYASEAVAAEHAWFDAHHPKTRSVCIINPDNAPSLRLAEKIGYLLFGRTTYNDSELVMLERLRPGA